MPRSRGSRCSGFHKQRLQYADDNTVYERFKRNQYFHAISGSFGTRSKDFSLVILHYTQTTGAVGRKLGVITESRDVNACVTNDRQDIFFICKFYFSIVDCHKSHDFRPVQSPLSLIQNQFGSYWRTRMSALLHRLRRQFVWRLFLNQRPKHLLRRATGRNMFCKLRIFVLTELHPCRTARSEQRQIFAGFQSLYKLACFFDEFSAVTACVCATK